MQNDAAMSSTVCKNLHERMKRESREEERKALEAALRENGCASPEDAAKPAHDVGAVHDLDTCLRANDNDVLKCADYM